MQQNTSVIEEYQKRVNIVVEYINNHLGENINLSTLAEISNFSPFHFQRIMKAFLGEPIGSFIIRKRVETAAQLIRHTDLPILDIAYRVGYDTPSSLSKVFKQFFNISPKEYRTNKNFVIVRPMQINENLNIKKAKVVELNDRQAIYLTRMGAYQSVDFGAAWQLLWQYVKENKLYSAGIEHIGVYYNDPKVTDPDKLQSDICLVLSKAAEPKGEIGVKTLKGGRFAMFAYEGSYEHLSQVYDTVYGKLLPESGFGLRDAHCFEKYVNNPETTKPDKLKTEIYIPIEE